MSEEAYTVKLYGRRWINLFLFIVYGMNNGLHYPQYSVINDSISAYYNVPHAYVEWTTGLFGLSYVLFSTPALYALDKVKLRHIKIFVSFLTTLGSWMKVFSVAPDRFLLAFIAQCIISISYTFMFGASARLIAVWFGIHETSRASALSLIGDQCGSAFGFMIPALMIKETLDVSIWEDSLRRMHILNASISTSIFILMILLFKDSPKLPPSIAQAVKIGTKSETFLKSFKKMMKNRAFLMLVAWYSFNAGMFACLAAVLGEIITMNFQNSYNDAGRIGFLMVGCGMVSTPLFGYLMDKTHKFKEVGILLTGGVFLSYLLLILALKSNNIVYVYIVIVFLGSFSMGTFVSSIQIGIEIIYPISEDKCSTVMAFIAQLFSCISLVIYGILLRQFGDIVTNSGVCVMTFVGFIICILGPVPLNRQRAEKTGKTKEMKQFLPKTPNLIE